MVLISGEAMLQWYSKIVS